MGGAKTNLCSHLLAALHIKSRSRVFINDYQFPHLSHPAQVFDSACDLSTVYGRSAKPLLDMEIIRTPRDTLFKWMQICMHKIFLQTDIIGPTTLPSSDSTSDVRIAHPNFDSVLMSF